MLCDEVVLTARNPRGTRLVNFASEVRYIREFAAMVEKAERFRLDREAVDVVLDVQETKPSSLVAGLGMCRLPHRIVWIEFDLLYRMQAMARYGYIPGIPSGMRDMQRGFLLVATDETLQRGVMYCVVNENKGRPILNPNSFMFDFSQPDTNVCFRRRREEDYLSTADSVYLNNFTLKKDDYSVRFHNQPDQMAALAHIENLFVYDMSPLAQDWMVDYQRNRGKRKFDELWKVLKTDVAGEPRFVLGILMLLNSRNLADFEARSVKQINRTRGVRDGTAVLSHRKVTIKLSKVSQNRMAAQGITTASAIALHKVRGHWKVRRTGIFFWRPHERGSRQHGEIVHEYEIVA